MTKVLTRIDLRGERRPFENVLPRPVDAGSSVAFVVAEILSTVRNGGDAAVAEFAARFDGSLGPVRAVDPAACSAALEAIDPVIQLALETAWSRLRAYHQLGSPPEPFEADGVRVRHLYRPVDRAGCYVPGGRGRYPSSLLMCAAAARGAGVSHLTVCTPPASDGSIDQATLAAAAIAGVDALYPVGGAHAIAAMAFGTETIEAVDVICGPGNSYVAEAKRQVSGIVGVASGFAGPSEVAVVGDDSTPAELAAIDLMVQAEHGPDGYAWLITTSPSLIDEVEAALGTMVAASPRQLDLASTFASGGFAVLTSSPEDSMAVVNVVAPEHLELLVDDYEPLVELVNAAGAVFCGVNAPASIGDYVAGPNHILPTSRTARFASALRASDFVKEIHVVEVTSEGLAVLGPHVEVLAKVEGFDAHAASIALRR